MTLALQLLLSLSILIVLHEMGHFIPAKIFKTRVEKFYLFFDPWFSLVKKKIGDTVYGIGWLPLGGYVKISGMVDESMDKDQLAKPPQPWEFRSKPAWQRLIIMIGGVTVNVILGFVIYWFVLAHWGYKVLPLENVTYGAHFEPVLEKIGFEDGDKILAVDDSIPQSHHQVMSMLFFDEAKKVTVERRGQKVEVNIPEDISSRMLSAGARAAITPRYKCVIDSFTVKSPADSAGLLKGDKIIGVNEVRSEFFMDIQQEIFKNKGKVIRVNFIRGDSTLVAKIKVSEEGAIGFYPVPDSKYLKYDTLQYSVGSAFPAAFRYAKEIIRKQVLSIRFLFSRAGVTQMGGFISIANIFPDKWNWWAFWDKTALLSLVLAVMNILPIPALDGGHVIFLIWEVITGKPVKQRVLEVAQMFGFLLLIGLILWANGLDIFRLFSGN
ncbi:MAG: RIP metalloprotease RseP [Flavobacteriales bacterium]|nr:RIP metalloprotease RseP [Flavobacteriales bacterium]